MRRVLHAVYISAAWLVSIEGAAALTIQLDYTYDANNFFSGANAGRRTYLQTAADTLGARLTDTLTAITPSGTNTWSEVFANPATGNSQSISNPKVLANTIVVYAGARDLGTSTLGNGGTGGISGSGSTAWLNTISARGQAGALATPKTDFGPWGGSLTFDLDTNWYFDPNPSTMESIGSQSDFFSVAVHELAHLLGFGTAPSWSALVSSGTFKGKRSMAVRGSAVPLYSDNKHWAEGISGHLEATGAVQETAMDPSLTVGKRKLFTDLDYAGLQDVGWQVKAIPEPASGWPLLCGASLLGGRRRWK